MEILPYRPFCQHFLEVGLVVLVLWHNKQDLPFFLILYWLRHLKLKKIKKVLSPQRLVRCSLDVLKCIIKKIYHFFTW